MDSPALTRAQARAADRYAVDHFQVPSLLLMENAARHAATVAWSMLTDRPRATDRPRVAILCGRGNNGGDGYAMARHLSLAGATVTAYAVHPPDALQGDAAIQAAIVHRLGLPVVDCHEVGTIAQVGQQWDEAALLVDALLGTGYQSDRLTSPLLASAMARCNQARSRGALVLAVDVPSGLDADTGKPAQDGIAADVTVTFIAPKAGFHHPGAAAHLGQVHVRDIGVPSSRLIQAVMEGRRD